MKKQLLAATACLVSAAAAYGQGQGVIWFQNYGGTTISPVTYTTSPYYAPPGKAGLAVGNTFKAELAYFIGTTTDPSQLTLLPSSVCSFYGTADGPVGANNGAGYFQGDFINLPGVTSPALASAVTFQVFVWQATGPYGGADFNLSSVAGHSTLFTMPVGGTGVPPAFPTDFGTYLQPFSVGLAPEPGALALSGLAATVPFLFRRRK